MGSFGVGCGISNLAVHEGDKLGFVILGKPRGTSRGLSGDVGKTLYTYNTDLYRPFLPPVFGEYGDYGRIVNVKESVTSKLLEQMFNRPVDDVLACITCNRSVYSRFGTIYKTYFTGSKRIEQYRASARDIFLSLDFEEVEDTEKTGTYAFGGFEIVHEKARALYSIRKDGQVLKPNIGGGSTWDITAVMDNFGDLTGLYPGFPAEDYTRIRLLNQLGGMFILEDVFNRMREGFNYGVWEQERLDFTKLELNKYTVALRELSKEDDPYFSYLDFAGKDFLTQNIAFPRDRHEELKVYADSDELMLIVSLVDICAAVNRMFIPSFCGEQDGNDEASQLLNNISGDILDQRIKEREEW